MRSLFLGGGGNRLNALASGVCGNDGIEGTIGLHSSEDIVDLSQELGLGLVNTEGVLLLCQRNIDDLNTGDSLGKLLGRLFIDHHVLDRVVLHIVNGETTVLIALGLVAVNAVEAPIGIAIYIVLAGRATLDADLDVGVAFELRKLSQNVVGRRTSIKIGTRGGDDKHLGCIVIRGSEVHGLLALFVYGKTGHCYIDIVLTDRGYNSIEVHILNDDLKAKRIGDVLGLEIVIEDMDFDAVVTSVGKNNVDVAMAGLTVNEKRKESVNF
ncbi:MAG: transporter substrate-binding domain-containing protein, partial [Clostridia bacterium]|nr:transporter substrate-binding domain-containing protein [Clostridia bacterium]